MRLRSRHVIALVVGVAVLIGAGVAVGQSQSPSPSPSSSSDRRNAKAVARSEFLDILARRLGIERSELDSALKAMALAEVQWAEDNGFITKAQADTIRERINSGEAKGLGRLGLHGPLGLALGGYGRHGGLWKGRFHRGAGVLTAAATYLGLSERELIQALRTKTLAQVARDQGKTVDGLTAAIRAEKKSNLDEAVAEGRITSAQANALLQRFDAEAGDLVNGIPPNLTELARRLGVERNALITAIKNAAIELVDKALAEGDITQAQADALKQRIRSSRAWPLGGRIGLCLGPGRFGLGRGLGLGRGHFAAPEAEEEVIGL
jgi:polyhydroxyalkanoate synthesis regulator phasin